MLMVLYVIMSVVLAVGAVVVIAGKKNSGNKKKRAEKVSKLLIKIYIKLDRFPLTGVKIRKISQQIQSMSVYTRKEVYIRAAKYFLTSYGLIFGIIAWAVISFKDIVSIMICIAFSFVFSNVLIDKKVDKTVYKVYNDLADVVSSIREKFLSLDSVPEALQAADCSESLRAIIDEIYTITTSANGELRLREFFEKTPFRPIQTLARMCYDINNVGDDTDVYGQSNFVESLTLMSSDINSEIERMHYQKKTFGIVEYLPIVPLFGINIIESYFSGIMPGTAMIYNGFLGYTLRILTMVSCIMLYSVIARINSSSSIKEDDRVPWSVKALQNYNIKYIVESYSPKNAKRRRVVNKLKFSLSKKNVSQVYLEKLVYAVATFSITLIVIVSAIALSKDYSKNTTAQLSLVASNEMKDYTKEDILNMDSVFMSMRKNAKLSDEEAMQLVKEYMPKIGELQATEQVKRMEDKYNSIKNSYFKWYYILVAYLIGLVGWTIPNIGLLLRKMLVKAEAEDDFIQMQTLMGIIMNTDCDTLDALEQLCQISKIHKDVLLYCYHSFPSNPQKELARLQSKTPIVEFKRFIGKLELTVSDLSMRDAFSNLVLERGRILSMREVSTRSSINKKRSICGILALVPIGLFVISELLVPIGYLGFLEFTASLGSMKGQ